MANKEWKNKETKTYPKKLVQRTPTFLFGAQSLMVMILILLLLPKTSACAMGRLGRQVGASQICLARSRGVNLGAHLRKISSGGALLATVDCHWPLLLLSGSRHLARLATCASTAAAAARAGSGATLSHELAHHSGPTQRPLGPKRRARVAGRLFAAAHLACGRSLSCSSSCSSGAKCSNCKCKLL